MSEPDEPVVGEKPALRKTKPRALSAVDAPSAALARIGLGNEPSRAARYLRAILAGLKEAAAKQIEQIPGIGPAYAGAVEALLQLSEEKDAEVFEAKIERLLNLGNQSTEDLEALSGLAAAIYIRQESLLQLLHADGLPTTPELLSDVATATALTAYHGRVAQDHRYADYRGIEGGTREEHAAALPLDEVYVLPRLIAEREQADTRDRERVLLKELLENQDLAPAERVRLEMEFATLTGARWQGSSKGQEAPNGISLNNMLPQNRHAVFIGGPGTGKSALTRYLARTCALGAGIMQERLGWSETLTPVVIPIAAYADARHSRNDLGLRSFIDERMRECGGEVLKAAIGTELSAGRAMLLFDGVDEVPQSTHRVAIVQEVERFIAAYPANRVIVTSRPYGYVRLAGDIPHFQLANFSSDQVQAFLNQWQLAFERWRRPEAPNIKKAEAEASEMWSEIERNSKVSELATNPLMLVILALIRHERTRLPEERVQLYNRAVNTLMDTWNRGRSLARIDVGGTRLPLDRLVRVWGAVAEWTRRTRPTGVAHRAELTRKLVEILREREYDEDNPEATAESYLNAAADRAGLVEERGRNVFAFWHPTFEEFLAAVELTTPSSRAVERLIPLREDPRWREVILLAVGYIGVVQRDGETATAMVEAIWKEKPTPLESLVHHHLRLAAACVADDVGVKRSLAERILMRFAEVIQEFPYPPLTSDFSRTVKALPRIRVSSTALQALASLITDEFPTIRGSICRLAANVASEDAYATEVCKLAFARWGHSEAALGLARAGDVRPEVWLSLNRHQVPETPVASDEVRKSLVSALKSEDLSLRFQAAGILQKRGDLSSEESAILYEDLLESSDSQLRLQVAGRLLTLGSSPKAEACLDLLSMSEDIIVRFAALLTLFTTIGRLSQDRFMAFLNSLQSSDPDNVELTLAKVIVAAAKMVGFDVDQSLVDFVAANDEGDFRSLAAAYICDTESSARTLEKFLSNGDLELRSHAAAALTRMGIAANGLEAALEPVLDARDLSLRLKSVSLMLRRENGSSKATSAKIGEVVEEALNSSDLSLRLRAAHLAQALGSERFVLADALQPIVNSENPVWRREATQLLLDKGNFHVIEDLAKRIQAQPWTALSACQKLMDGVELDVDDAVALADLTRRHDDDTPEQREARELLFSWFISKLETKQRPDSVTMTFQISF